MLLYLPSEIHRNRVLYSNNNTIHNVIILINTIAHMDPAVNILNKIHNFYDGKITGYRLEALIYKPSIT